MKYKVKRYHIDPDSRGAMACAALMGVSFFLRAVYYFGFTRTETVGVWELLSFLILPMVVEALFMVFLRGVRLDMPLMYGVLGAVCCVLLILQAFQYGNVVRTILAIIAYVVCGGIFAAVTMGLLSKEIGVTLFFVTGGVRFLFDLKPYVFSFHPVAFLPEAAGLCVVFALGALASGLWVRKK